MGSGAAELVVVVVLAAAVLVVFATVLAAFLVVLAAAEDVGSFVRAMLLVLVCTATRSFGFANVRFAALLFRTNLRSMDVAATFSNVVVALLVAFLLVDAAEIVMREVDAVREEVELVDVPFKAFADVELDDGAPLVSATAAARTMARYECVRMSLAVRAVVLVR